MDFSDGSTPCFLNGHAVREDAPLQAVQEGPQPRRFFTFPGHPPGQQPRSVVHLTCAVREAHEVAFRVRFAEPSSSHLAAEALVLFGEFLRDFQRGSVVVGGETWKRLRAAYRPYEPFLMKIKQSHPEPVLAVWTEEYNWHQ